MKEITKRFTSVILVALLCIVTVICGRGKLYAMADTEDSVRAAYESTNVLNNLKGATIGCKEFDLADYPHNDNGKPQIISFVEFCYSYYADKQEDFGLYVYVYNPQDVVFDMSGESNKIQFTYGNVQSYSKYVLEFLNYSTEAGYEGRFWEFKVRLTDEQKSAILREVDENSRVYKVSGIELSVKNQITEYVCAQIYTYKGYALGYGSELAQSDTLSCNVDGLETYVELNVNHTLYRAKGDYYNGEQSQLNSCYFRVPNKFFTDYGELTNIACEWYEYFTKPILVTESQYTYSKINGLHGKDTDTLPEDTYFLFNVFWQNSKTSWFGKSGISDWTSNYGYEVGDTYHWGFLWLDGAEVIFDPFYSFAGAFYTGGSSCEDYEISGDELRAKLLENSAYMGAPYVHDRYSKSLFEDYVQEGRKYGYNYKEIKADDKFDIFWNYTTKNLWQKIFTGDIDVDTVYESLDAIVKINDSDLTGGNTEIAERLKIHTNDVEKLKAEQKKAKANDETVVLFRYSSTKYFSAPCVSSYCSKGNIDGGKTLVRTNCDNWGNNDFNAYVCQETVYLDFDIISLTYTRDGVDTVIPVVSSPQDVIGGLQAPLEDPFADEPNWLAIILGIILLIVIIILLLKFVPGVLVAIFKGIIWIICLPFRLLGALFKAIGNSFKKHKERKQAQKETEDTARDVKQQKKEKRKKKSRKSEETDIQKKLDSGENLSRDEIESYLDTIDWDAINGS